MSMLTSDQLREIIQSIMAQVTHVQGAGGSEGNYRKLQEKDFRRVEKFAGGEDAWRAWEFDFKVALRATDKKVAEALEEIETPREPPLGPITAEIIHADDPTYWAGLIERSKELCDVLCMLITGDAKAIIREVHGGDGFAAWQSLLKAYSRKTLARSLRKYREVMNPQPVKDVTEILGFLAKWENKMKELERTENIKIPEMIKMAALTELCTEEIRDMIYQNVDSGATFEVIKEKVVSWVSNRVASRSSPTPMDIGACQPEEDWGWEDNGEEDINAVGNAVCHRCGGTGHFARNCATPAKVKGKGPDYGKGAKGYGKSGMKAEYGKGTSSGKGKSAGKGFPGKCWNCNETGHRADQCQKTWAIEEETFGVAQVEDFSIGGVWHVGSVEVEKVLDADALGAGQPRVLGEDSLGPWNVVRRKRKKEDGEKCERGLREREKEGVEDGEKRKKEDGEKCERLVREREKDGVEDGDEVPIYAVHESKESDLITIDSGAAESVWPENYKQEIPLRPADKAKAQARYVTANGEAMTNKGKKLVHFRTGQDPSVKAMEFQVTQVKKPLASVRRIVEKGNIVVFKKDGSYIQGPNGRKTPLVEHNGTYALDIKYAAEEVFSRRAI